MRGKVETVEKLISYRRSIVRQIPEKSYTFEECLDLLRVPAEYRHELSGFGNKIWTNGDSLPEFWICKNLSLRRVSNKIHNIMRQ